MSAHHQINYVEFPARNPEATKVFFQTVFGWSFEDYGPDYSCFSEQGIGGGFYRCEAENRVSAGGALIVLYSRDLEATEAAIREAGGEIVKPIFAFPGGRRFHFTEPSGNELAVWSE